MGKQAKNKTSETIKETSIPGLLVIQRPTFPDNRGFFHEVCRLADLAEGAPDFKVAQINHSLSKPGVIRGLHAEVWDKLVYPVTGKIFAAIVDIRPDMPTFGTLEKFELDSKEHKALFIPKGLANSICVIGSEPVHYIYMVNSYYDGSDTRAIAWDDPDLNIAWPIADPIISDRDRANPTLRELYPEKFR